MLPRVFRSRPLQPTEDRCRPGPEVRVGDQGPNHHQSYRPLNLQVGPSALKKSYDYLFKILLCGDSGVGKTALMHRYCEHAYSPQFVTTIGLLCIYCSF